MWKHSSYNHLQHNHRNLSWQSTPLLRAQFPNLMYELDPDSPACNSESQRGCRG